MDRLTAFQTMVLSIATIRTMRDNRWDAVPSQVLGKALLVTESDLSKAQIYTKELSALARSFVDWQMLDDGKMPPWLPQDFDARRPYYGGERDA